jgi:hypothetical protein
MCVADIPCMNRGVWGHTTPEHFWNLKPGNAISCIPSIQICSKIYANYTCIWNKRRKKTNKRFKTILTIIYHYLLEGDSNGQRPLVWGHTLAENFWNLKPGNAISCIPSIQICSKIYANYTCIWNKRRKKRTKGLKKY